MNPSSPSESTKSIPIDTYSDLDQPHPSTLLSQRGSSASNESELTMSSQRERHFQPHPPSASSPSTASTSNDVPILFHPHPTPLTNPHLSHISPSISHSSHPPHPHVAPEHPHASRIGTKTNPLDLHSTCPSPTPLTVDAPPSIPSSPTPGRRTPTPTPSEKARDPQTANLSGLAEIGTAPVRIPTHQIDLESGNSKVSGISAGSGISGESKETKVVVREKVWPPWKRHDGWSGWLAESCTTRGMVNMLVLQAFSTGILDATTYADFTTFASNQTGNTILLCVSILGTVRVLILLTGISLASFLGGSFIFGHLGHFFGLRRRAWLFASTTYQILALFIACILVSPVGPAATNVGGKHDWVVIFLFANMSGCQVAMARQSQCAELPTAPMTSSYVDLMADKYLFVGFKHPKAGPRNRRLAYIVVMIVGGFIGAGVHMKVGSWPVVAITIGIKLVVLGMMCVIEAEPRDKGK